jgi:hypothetical protein
MTSENNKKGILKCKSRANSSMSVSFEGEVEHNQISKRVSNHLDTSLQLLRPKRSRPSSKMLHHESQSNISSDENLLFASFINDMVLPHDYIHGESQSTIFDFNSVELSNTIQSSNKTFWGTLFVMEQEK